jgi:hypothetical protein
MRRSVRDAIVGFTVLGGLVGFAATGLWMRGIRLGSSDWRLTANFNDAAGLGRAFAGDLPRHFGWIGALDQSHLECGGC